MKKNVLKRTFAAVAVSALALSASAVSAFAEENEYIASYGFSDEEIAASEVKPTISIEKKTITLAEAANPQTVEVTVSGADSKYATLGLYFAYDTRLTLVPDGADCMTVETAFMRVAGEQRDLGEETVDGKTAKWIYMNGAASSDKGKDGLALTITFTLPADAAAGDKYPVELVYRSSESIVSRFTDAKNTQTGKLMQAWLFTQGIDNGYIEIEAETTTETTTTETTTTTTEEETTTTTTAPAQSTTAKATTTAAKATTTAAPQNAPKTGVAGVGVAVAGLAVAVGTAFVLRKKED